MKAKKHLRIALPLLLLAALQGCEFGSAPGGGTGGEGLTGVVVDGTGAPVAGARVRVYPASVAGLGKSARVLVAKADSTFTGSDGRYAFRKLPSGTYDLEASIRSKDTTFTLFVGGIVFEKNLDLGVDTLQASGRMTLRVQGENGEAVAGAPCEIAAGRWSGVSDTAGVCAIKDVPPGVHRVSLRHGGQVFPVDVVVRSGMNTDAGAVRLGVAPRVIPGGWRLFGIQGYDFYLPPGMELEWERAGQIDWDSLALFTGEGMRLVVGTGRMKVPQQPWTTTPEFSPDTLMLDASRYPPIRLALRGGEIPVTAAAYSTAYTPYLMWATVHDMAPFGSDGPFPAYPGGPILEFTGWAEKRGDLEILAKALSTIRKWKGAGDLPPNPPARPLLVSPAHAALDITGSPTLRWRDPHGSATTRHYRVQVSFDSAFSSFVSEDSVPVSVAAVAIDPSLGVGPLQSGRYFWRVVAVGAGGSTPSLARRLEIALPPVAPQLLGPGPDSATRAWPLTFAWRSTAANNAQAYRLQVASDSAFTSILLNDPMPNEPDSTGRMQRLLHWSGTRDYFGAGTFYWRVAALNSQGVSAASPARRFTTVEPRDPYDAVPAVMSLNQPMDKATGVSRTPDVQIGVYYNGSGIRGYNVQVSRDSLFETLDVSDTVYSQYLFDPLRISKALLPETRYFWRMIALGPKGSTSVSQRWSFTTGP